MIYCIILISVFIILAGILKGFMDALQFHYKESFFVKFKNDKFWNPKISWKNKYNPILLEQGLKASYFPGSTTYLVWLTDGWHLLQMIYLNCLFIAFGIAFSTRFVLIYNTILTIILATVVFAILFKTVFEIVYSLSYK